MIDQLHDVITAARCGVGSVKSWLQLKYKAALFHFSGAYKLQLQ